MPPLDQGGPPAGGGREQLIAVGRLGRGRGAPANIDVTRRDFVQLVGGTLAMLSGGCSVDVPRKIMPYTRQPRDVVPGVARQYATSLALDGYAAGVLVTAREGRPIKVEPNPDHPASLGGTTNFQQAAIWQLYDDWRARRIRRGAETGTWRQLFAALRAPRRDRGAGLRLLLEPTASPLTLAVLARVIARYPEARVAFHAPLQSGADVEGARLAFGRPLLPQYDLSNASAIVALDADFLAEMPLSPRYARQWARGRDPNGHGGAMNRIYAVEGRVSVTGSVADERLARPLRAVPRMARAIAAHLPVPAALRSPVGGDDRDDSDRWVRAAAADLLARPRGSTVVIAGDRQPPAVHALASAMNAALGNIGATVSFTAPVLPVRGADAGLPLQLFDDLVADMRAGRVDTLLIAGTNPVYTAPADLGFADALGRVRESIYAGTYEDETGSACGTMAPIAHPFESWGDARAYDGTVSMIQPLIEPLVDGRALVELLAALAGEPLSDAYRLLRTFWTRDRGLRSDEWAEAIRSGFQRGSAAPAVTPPPADAAAIAAAMDALPERAAQGGTIDVELYPSPTVHDGRFANNAWLQEQPSPVTKLTWDNAAFVSPATARAFGLKTGTVVDLADGGATVRAPVMVVPGTADGIAAVWLGYGRRGQEAVAAGVGFDAYPLRTRAQTHAVANVAVHARAEGHAFARTQAEASQHDRVFALQLPLDAYRRDPEFAAPYRAPVPSLMPEYPYTGHQWAMSIDLGICTGCSACTVACMAENNIPVVGRDQVARGRDMNWLRIDTYVAGTATRPTFVHQPMMCQHCEKAPCEYVCPVEATTHSPDGLNEMIYNRCVGTRFCSNNCPYKVRRFNWFDWGDRVPLNRGLVQLQYNPDVTVRERGVMEKCTYCVQRIRGAGIRARLDGRDLAPGEVMTACQAACPTGAIAFGSLAHVDTEMVRRRADLRAYAVLQREEGTQPRTIYLARVDNPNPEIAG